MTLAKLVGNLVRTQEIVVVLVRKGFRDLLQRMGLSQFLTAAPADEEGIAQPRDVYTAAARVREAMEELGGAFVKLGQLLSTRPDILPKNWIEELSRLQDEVTPLAFEQVFATLEDELGPWADKFTFVDPEPLAAGSIAQVHRAVTLAGEDVVVKVRKPGIRKTLLQDCDILESLAELLEGHVSESRNYRPVQVVQEFRRAVIRELDFTQEGRNLDRFRDNFAGHPFALFPRPIWDLTTEGVLTMERIEGIKISLLDQLRERGVDTVALAHNLAEVILRQILDHGFFHGDPHPGNLMVVDGSRLCFLDCGMVGHMDERMRENLLMLVAAGIYRDVEGIADILIEMNALPEDFDRNEFFREAGLFLERYYRAPLKSIRIASIIEEAMGLVNRYQVKIPSELVLVGKALITLEGIGRTLDPEFDSVAVATPVIRQMVITYHGPKYVMRRVSEGIRDLFRLARELPSDLRELARLIRENQLKIVVEHRGLTGAMEHLDRAATRLSMSIVVGSLVLGSSVVFLSGRGPLYEGIPVLALIGFAVAAAVGVVFAAASYLRKRRG